MGLRENILEEIADSPYQEEREKSDETADAMKKILSESTTPEEFKTQVALLAKTLPPNGHPGHFALEGIRDIYRKRKLKKPPP